MRGYLRKLTFAIAAAAALGVASARAADCGDSADGFNEWLASFKQVAIRNGVSPQVADAALNGVVSSPRSRPMIAARGFGQSFAAFSARHASPALIKKGKTMMLAYAEPFQKIEQRYGVPGPVLAAIWGRDRLWWRPWRLPTFSALATLAYDCRRSQIYRAELVDAMMLVQRGLLRPEQMRGAWAGEIGQTQFMPSAYLKYAVNVERRRGGNLMRFGRRIGVDRQFPAAATAGSRGPAGTKASRTSAPCSNGTPPRSTRRRLHCSPTS